MEIFLWILWTITLILKEPRCVLLYISIIKLKNTMDETIFILLFSYLTQQSQQSSILHLNILSGLIIHITAFTITILIYLDKITKKMFIVIVFIASIFPNYYFNPIKYNTIDLCLRMILYYKMVHLKSPNKKISLYVRFGWIFFVHPIFLVLIPIQIVYDTYYYKINRNIV